MKRRRKVGKRESRYVRRSRQNGRGRRAGGGAERQKENEVEIGADLEGKRGR